MKKIICALCIACGLSSCEEWFDIKPQTELVSNDFWQSKSDVESAVAACYRAFLEPDMMERLIVWGEVRSDNVLTGLNVSNDIYYILTANVDASNGYLNSATLLKVSERCAPKPPRMRFF